jgi:hypothetical protein
MEILFPMRKNMQVCFLKVIMLNYIFCRYCCAKMHNIVPWKWANESTSHSSTHICGGSGREGEKVQKDKYECVLGKARLITPAAHVFCFIFLCI